MSQVQRRFLRALRDGLDRGVPASAVPAACDGIVAALETCGAIERRPAGRGELLRVRSVEAFGLFVSDRFPLGLEDPGDTPADRVSGVRLHGDAKAAVRGRNEGVFLRSTKPGTSLESESGQILPVAEWTSIGGVAALTLEETRRWRFTGTVAIVENAEPFWQFERELPQADLAVYASGRLSERMLGWLASEEMAGCRFVHWGDYDPVGCMEYVRLCNRCPGRAIMHVPARVADLLPVYGKQSLLTDQIDTLSALRGVVVPPEVGQLLAMFDQLRRGLEQEALLL
jgi:hypothetical protein